MLEKPLKIRKPTNQLSHTLLLLRGGLCFILLPLAAGFYQRHTHSSHWMLPGLGNTTPCSPSPFSLRGIHYNNKPHSFQGHSQSEISDRDQHFRNSQTCWPAFTPQAACFMCHCAEKWSGRGCMRKTSTDKSPFYVSLSDHVRWLFKHFYMKLCWVNHQDKWDKKKTILEN